MTIYKAGDIVRVTKIATMGGVIMEINQFLFIMSRIKSLQSKMAREGIREEDHSIILKIYLSEMTDRINLNMVSL